MLNQTPLSIIYQVKQNETSTWKSWTLTNAVQYWLADPNTNYGVILWTPDENLDGYDMRFRSSEHTNKPKLEVVWSNQHKTVYFLKDHLGSVRATVDQTGAVVGYDDYDPWGYILEGRTQPTEWSVTQGVAENKFTGKERDEEHSLNWDFFGARYYDAEIGRWMSVDPLANIAPELSPYQYSRNNPVLLFDPDGKSDPLTISLFAARVVASLSTTLSNSNIGQALTTRINVPGKIDITVGEAITSTVEQNLSKLPTQEQVVGALDQIEEVSGRATVGLSIAALATSVVPPVQEALAGAAGITATVNSVAALGKATITQDSGDLAKAGANILANQAGNKLSKAIAAAGGGDAVVEETFRSVINVMTGTTSAAIEDEMKKKEEHRHHNNEEKDNR